MVAAWMSAETGVGPSIASGSQTWSGNMADLPMQPHEEADDHEGEQDGDLVRMPCRMADERTAAGRAGAVVAASAMRADLGQRVSMRDMDRRRGPSGRTETVPIMNQSVRMPIMKPKSARRLQTKALFAACAAHSCSYQKPMSR